MDRYAWAYYSSSYFDNMMDTSQQEALPYTEEEDLLYYLILLQFVDWDGMKVVGNHFDEDGLEQGILYYDLIDDLDNAGPCCKDFVYLQFLTLHFQ